MIAQATAFDVESVEINHKKYCETSLGFSLKILH